MRAKEIFQKNKELRNWWAKVVDDPMFENVLLHVRGAFLELEPGPEQLKGAKMFEAVISTLAEADDLAGKPFPSPGLIHNVEKMPDKPQPVPAAEQPKEQDAKVKRPQGKRAQ